MIALLMTYKYVAFFLGMIVGGDIVLLTGFYLALHGTLDLRYVIPLAFVATILSDLVWYELGKFVTRSRLSHGKLATKYRLHIAEASRLFQKYSFKAVLYSKFIYGTRTVTQMLAGAHHLNMRRYIAINALGTLLYGALLLLLTFTLNIGIEELKKTIASAEILFALFIASVFLINLWIQKTLKKRLYQS